MCKKDLTKYYTFGILDRRYTMNQTQITSMVEDWDEVYKRSQLTLWVMLALAHGQKYSAEIAQFMADATNDVFAVQEQSLYRALRRFKRMGLVDVIKRDSPQGPKRKYYHLTDAGREVLRQFLDMHIRPMYHQDIKDIVTAVLQKGPR